MTTGNRILKELDLVTLRVDQPEQGLLIPERESEERIDTRAGFVRTSEVLHISRERS
jgi:hypothetical protein